MTIKTTVAVLLLAVGSIAQIAIVDVSVIPMDRNIVLAHQTVVIVGERITAIGSAKTTKPPQGAQIINGSGKFLIPGLIDAHVHLLSPDQFQLYVANGVTTVFNLEGRPAHLAWRKQVQEGKLLGPTIFTSGPIFFGSGTVATGVKAVNQQADAGYDAFKIILQGGSPEVFPAVAAEAKKRNLLFIGHIPRQVGAEAAVASGMSVAHAYEFLYTYFNPKRAEDVRHDNQQHVVADETRIPALARMVRESGVIVEPTMIVYRDGVEEATNLDQFLKRDDLKYLAPWVLDNISPAKNRFKGAYKPADYPLIREFYPFQQKIVRALFDAGVPLLAGTDATDSGPVAGFSLHEELEELTMCGLSPYEALKTATVNPATYLRNAQDFGSIEVGKRADLVLLNANPLQKISNTRQIAGVMLRGEWFDQQKLVSMLDGLAATYAKEQAEFVRNLEQNPKQAVQWATDNDPFHGFTNYTFTELINQQSADQFKTFLYSIKEKDAESPFIAEAALNQFGYDLLGSGKSQPALAIFTLNTEFYPKSANTFDSLGEAQFKMGNASEAVASYRKALEVDPKYVNAEFAKKFVTEHGN